MLRLTIKTFYPPKPPLPLMHIDTTWKFKEWKFKEMIAFRDATVKRHWGCA
jgi:sulfate adenylyltransferase subunit 2